jgi:hypothetical protein
MIRPYTPKTTRIGFLLLVVIGVVGLSGPVFCRSASGAQKLTVQQEWHDHPNLVRAVRAMEAAIRDLDRAPNDFGGNKARAIRDLRAAIHSLKKAILYRLHMSDEDIDKAQVQ